MGMKMGYTPKIGILMVCKGDLDGRQKSLRNMAEEHKHQISQKKVEGQVQYYYYLQVGECGKPSYSGWLESPSLLVELGMVYCWVY